MKNLIKLLNENKFVEVQFVHEPRRSLEEKNTEGVTLAKIGEKQLIAVEEIKQIRAREIVEAIYFEQEKDFVQSAGRVVAKWIESHQSKDKISCFYAEGLGEYVIFTALEEEKTSV
jgi:hypothetical protein